MKFFLLFIIFFNTTILNAKRDFYYGFINSSGNQISQKNIQDIEEGFQTIKHARQLSREGKLDDAITQLKAFQEKNKIKILESDIIILLGELALKKGSKRLILDSTVQLEQAINSSTIHDDDLAKAYMVLVNLKLNTNKSKEAKYFANIIINNFDNKVTKAYGEIYLAKVYKHEKEYLKATKILYEVLTKTRDLLVATIVADELFDVYIADKKIDKAHDLISKVLKKNIDYYAKDSYIAINKVNKLVKAGMPGFAAEILKELLKKTKRASSIESFKFKLADVYMKMYDGTDKYLNKAKELYKDILNDYPQGIYTKKSKMFIDEILMRQNILKPILISEKYPNSESMQQKVLIQELLNNRANKRYDFILKSKKVYRKVSDQIAKRFGFDSVNSIYDQVAIDMIKQYLNEGKCFLLRKVLKSSRSQTFDLLIKNEKVKDKFFECLIEAPYKKGYEQLKETFNLSRKADIYLYLERMALALKKYNEAESFSAKIDMVDNKKILQKEFLYRFLLLSAKNDPVSMDKFFAYARKNKNYIAANDKNPIIIDFYYSYYLYLTKKNFKKDAIDILNKLYDKQNLLKAHVYSPFVELELSKIARTNNDNNKALKLLLDALDYSRVIKPNDLAQIYYEISQLYGEFNNTLKRNEFIDKCKGIENTKDSLYKKMCDEM